MPYFCSVSVTAADQVIRLDPKSAIAYERRGEAYFGNGDYDRAIADFDQVIRLDPNYAIAYFERGVAFHKKGNYDRAIEDFNAVKRVPSKPQLPHKLRTAPLPTTAVASTARSPRPFSPIWKHPTSRSA
jgi:tetratricopeptide (TPR) repeat protein